MHIRVFYYLEIAKFLHIHGLFLRAKTTLVFG